MLLIMNVKRGWVKVLGYLKISQKGPFSIQILYLQLNDLMEDLHRIGMTYRKRRLLRGGIMNPLRDPLLLPYLVAGAALFLWGIATTLT
jgi:hypothetical protein